MYSEKRPMCASDAQDVYDGVNSASRPSPRNYIPANTGVVASHEGPDLTTHEKHGPHLTRAGRKIDAVYGCENAPFRPSPPEVTVARQDLIHAQPSIDRLPNELLCAIFLLTGDPSPISGFPRDRDMHDNGKNSFAVQFHSKAAVILGRVCSRWMNVTRGFPALWTLVDVSYPGTEATAILKRCLVYSAGLPLVLWISKSVNPDAGYYGIDPRFMRLVAAHAHRWSEISIEMCDERDALQPLVVVPPGSFTALRRARIEFWRGRAGPDSADRLLWKSFLISPQITAVDWENQYIRTGLTLAPLRQLTEIGLHFAEPDMLPPILSTCSALEVLYIGIYPLHLDLGSTGLKSIQSTFYLPRLRVLMLCGPTDWTPLFASLTVPALDRLDISHMDVYYADIEIMLRRSSARVKMLTIFWPTIRQEKNVVALLQSSAMHYLEIVRYEHAFPGDSRLGWEDKFDLRPLVPSHVMYTTDYTEAEGYYRHTQRT